MSVRGLLALALALAAAPAGAASCIVDPQSVAFGSYDPLDAAPLDSVGTIRVSCDSSASFSVALRGGGGSIDDRRMTSGADALHYNLYSNAARTALWGDGNGAGDVSATGATVDLDVYGRIPARQNVPAGTYVDSVTVTVTF